MYNPLTLSLIILSYSSILYYSFQLFILHFSVSHISVPLFVFVFLHHVSLLVGGIELNRFFFFLFYVLILSLFFPVHAIVSMSTYFSSVFSESMSFLWFIIFFQFFPLIILFTLLFSLPLFRIFHSPGCSKYMPRMEFQNEHSCFWDVTYKTQTSLDVFQ